MNNFTECKTIAEANGLRVNKHMIDTQYGSGTDWAHFGTPKEYFRVECNFEKSECYVVAYYPASGCWYPVKGSNSDFETAVARVIALKGVVTGEWQSVNAVLRNRRIAA